MNFEDLNNEYLRLKSAVEKYGVDLKKAETDLKKALKDKENAENALKAAKTDKDKKNCQQILNKVLTEIEDIQVQIDSISNRIEDRKKSIEEIISKVKAIPEISEQCKRAIDVRTDRQIAKFEKQKEEQEKKKTVLVQLKSILEKHPQAQIYFNGIEIMSLGISKAELEIKELQDKIDKLDPKDPNYHTELAKLTADKSSIEKECEDFKNKRQEARGDLKKLLNNPKFNEQIDNLTTRNALSKDINNCDRLIKRSENKIHDYKYAKDSLYKEAEPTTPEHSEEKPKWYQFGKRFAAWNEARKQKKLPEPPPGPVPASSFKDEIKLNGQIMKYDVVRNLYQSELKDRVNEGKESRQDDGSR